MTDAITIVILKKVSKIPPPYATTTLPITISAITVNISKAIAIHTLFISFAYSSTLSGGENGAKVWSYR